MGIFDNIASIADSQRSNKQLKDNVLNFEDCLNFFFIDSLCSFEKCLAHNSQGQGKGFAPLSFPFLEEGEDSEISGYKSLSIDFYVFLPTYQIFVKIEEDPTENPSISVSQIKERLVKMSEYLNFELIFSSVSFREHIHEHKSKVQNSLKDTHQEVEIICYSQNVSKIINEGLIDQNKEILPLIDKSIIGKLEFITCFFIDGSSIIDIEDPKWSFFLCIQEGIVKGFSSIYQFNLNSEIKRMRISQLIVFPFFQKKGMGKNLLSSIYNTYISDNSVNLISVECPNDSFTCLQYKVLLNILTEKRTKEFSVVSNDILNGSKSFTSLNSLIQTSLKISAETSDNIALLFLLNLYKNNDSQCNYIKGVFSEHIRSVDERRKRRRKDRVNIINGTILTERDIKRIVQETMQNNSEPSIGEMIELRWNSLNRLGKQISLLMPQ